MQLTSCRRAAVAVFAFLSLWTAAAAGGAGKDVIFLGAQATRGTDMGRGLLIREQVRQAILIAAREEMGLTTRDAALGECEPVGPSTTDVRLDVDLRKSLKAEIFQGANSVWSGEQRLQVGSKLHEGLTAACEAWSRKELVAALTAAGFTPVARPDAKAADGGGDKGAEVSDEVTALLARMNAVSQFDAARRLHEAIRTRGPSRAATGALVRAYANLGALCERQWYAADRVFKARALLYAQRMVATETQPRSAYALWHRAYARAMTGLSGAALADLAAAEKIADPARDGGPPPAWVAQIRAFCNYDATALEAQAKRVPADAPFVTFLALLDVTGSGSAGEVIEKGKRAFEADPENPYVMDRMTGAAGVSYGHLMTTACPQVFIGKTLLRTLPACAGLPTAVLARIKALGEGKVDAAAIARVWQALVAAGADTANDRGEPSWGALGRIVRETHFLQTYRRAAFLRYWLGAGDSATQFVSQNLAVIGDDHPFRSFVQSFAVDAREDPAKFDDLIADVRLVDATAPARQWMNYAKGSQPKGAALFKKNSQRLYAWTDGVARDVELQYTMSYDKDWQMAIARQLSAISPKSPYAAGILLAHDWPAQRAKAGEYERWAPGSSYLLGVLARKYVAEERVDDAVRCFKGYLQIAKDAWVYEALADLHLKQGDEAGWLATLEAYLREAEDFGLTHANVRVRIARGLMSRGKYHQALPYAQAAAHTGAAWAINCAAECYEGLGDVDRAAAFYRDSAESYPQDSFTYWFWYKRSKDPKSADAEKMVLKYVADTKVISPDLLGAFYLIKGDYKAAIDAYGPLDDATMSSHVGLHIALAADANGDVALRDLALQQVVNQPRSGRTRIYFASLAKLFQEALAMPKPKLDLAAVDQLIEKHEGLTRTTLNEMTGRFLLKRGETREAMRYLRPAIQDTAMGGLEFNLAWAALAEMGVDPHTLREPVKD